MALTDMTLTPEESKQENGLGYSDDGKDGPKYPYGLSLYLTDDVMKKLGMPMPSIGASVNVQAVANVTSLSANQEIDGEVCQTVSLQITQLDITGASSADATASKLWPAS